MNIKIKDVAIRAGVSPTTVSRVMNNHQLVSEDTKKRVLLTIEEMGYQPNASAKNLRSQRTQTIGVLVSDINVSYYAEIIKGIQDQAAQKKYKVIICDTDNKRDREEEYLNLLVDRTVDGLILVTPSISDDRLATFIEQGYSIGLIGRKSSHPSIFSAHTDNVLLAREAVQHLIDQGHKKIAHISGFSNAIDSYERMEGYMKALKENKLSFNPKLLENGDFNEIGGYRAFVNFIKTKEPFTAVFAANDEIALGVFKACKELNIKIPCQMALVGVDDNRICQYTTPTLSTVAQPKYEMGFRLTEILIDDLNREDSRKGNNDITLPSKLIIRESSVAKK